MNRRDCLRLCRELVGTDAPAAALRALPDGEFVMSLVEGERAARFYRDPRAELEAGGEAPWEGARAFARLARRLGLDDAPLRAAAATGLGWPFYGLKARREGCAVTLYLIERSLSERSDWRALAPVLALAGVTAEEARAACPGRYDCLGLDVGGGVVELKVYTRFASDDELPRAPREATHLRWWRRVARSAPVRHWTRAVRFRAGRRGPCGVKTEVHFREDVEPAALARAAGRMASARWVGQAAAWVADRGGRFSSLAAEGGRACLYFR